jgi:murein DD-endopeptidase MepM/ murein hydrolase activator NlpD
MGVKARRGVRQVLGNFPSGMPGQKVNKGQKIAEVGDTGSLNGTSLYFEIWRGSEALPTRRWLGGR